RLVATVDRRPLFSAFKATDRVASGSQFLEQLASLDAAVAWRAFQIREALSQDRRFLRVGLANLLDDLLKRHGFTAHGHALGVVVQNHFGPLQAALRLDCGRRAFPSPAAPKPQKGHEDDPNPSPCPYHVCSSSGDPSSRNAKGQKSPS